MQQHNLQYMATSCLARAPQLSSSALCMQVASKACCEAEQNAADAGSRLQQALEHVANLTEQVPRCGKVQLHAAWHRFLARAQLHVAVTHLLQSARTHSSTPGWGQGAEQ